MTSQLKYTLVVGLYLVCLSAVSYLPIMMLRWIGDHCSDFWFLTAVVGTVMAISSVRMYLHVHRDNAWNRYLDRLVDWCDR